MSDSYSVCRECGHDRSHAMGCAFAPSRIRDSKLIEALTELLTQLENDLSDTDPIIRRALQPPAISRHPDETEAEFRKRIGR